MCLILDNFLIFVTFIILSMRNTCAGVMPAANEKKQRSRHQVLIKRNMFFGWLVITHDDKSLLDIFVPVSCHLQKKQMSRHQFVIRRDMFFGRLVFTA